MNELYRFSQNFMISMGICMYIFGSVGNLLNICVFFRWSTAKTAPSSSKCNSALYLLVSSVSNLIIIVYPFLTRILLDGFRYSITARDRFLFCQLRYYILYTFDLVSLTCVCMATFDRYLITSRKVRMRELSPGKKRTEQILLFIFVFHSIHTIPIGVFFDLSKMGECLIHSIHFRYYYLWVYQIFLHSLFPIVFLTIFGSLTYRQLRTISHRKKSADKQLSRMLLLMSIAIVFSSIPYCIEQISSLIFPKIHLENSSLMYFCHVLTSIFFYTNPVTSFYIFFLSTRNFRRQVKKILFLDK